MERRVRHHHQVHRGRFERGHRRRARRERAVVEFAEHVAADGGEHRRPAALEQRQRLRDAAGGLERFALGRIREPHAPARTVAERRLDLGRATRG
jgi:hypothetical protein